jgi:crotonobetainyl-CoA:carnitine CoA-transferase CaiB-like acyl-CoA transferase
VFGLLLALFHRNRTGQGQQVWTSILHGSMLHTLDSWVAADGAPSPRPALDREQLGLSALYRLYETHDGWVMLAAVRDEHFPALCAVLERPGLATDPRFATAAGRDEHRAELTAFIGEAFLADDAVAWVRRLDAAGVPAEVSADTNSGETFVFDHNLASLGVVVEHTHPVAGPIHQFGNLMTFGGTPTRPERTAPMLGEHTRELLTELGYDDVRIDDLRDRGVVSWPDESYPFPV